MEVLLAPQAQTQVRTIDDPRRSLQKRPVAVTSKPASKISADAFDLALITLPRQVAFQLCAPTPRSTLQYVSMVQ